MQPRTKQHLMTAEAVDALLARVPVGILAMTGPYAIPVHFVMRDGKIYIHGSTKGEKIDRMTADRNVCLSIFEMTGYNVDNPKTACNINTAYESIIVKGKVCKVADPKVKKVILYAFTDKYYPSLSKLDMPQASIDGTTLLEITPYEITGKKV